MKLTASRCFGSFGDTRERAPQKATLPPEREPCHASPDLPGVPDLQKPRCTSRSGESAPLAPHTPTSKPAETRTVTSPLTPSRRLTKIQALRVVSPKLCPYSTRLCTVCCAFGSKQRTSRTRKRRRAEGRGRRRAHGPLAWGCEARASREPAGPRDHGSRHPPRRSGSSGGRRSGPGSVSLRDGNSRGRARSPHGAAGHRVRPGELARERVAPGGGARALPGSERDQSRST